LSEGVEVDVWRGFAAGVGLRDVLADGLGLGGAEEEAVEHQLEHAPVIAGLGQRSRQRLLEVPLLGPGDVG
jgi:hypothetical protein